MRTASEIFLSLYLCVSFDFAENIITHLRLPRITFLSLTSSLVSVWIHLCYLELYENMLLNYYNFFKTVNSAILW